ncbi:MAG: membrane integrity-associated transporter subunit PqiC [Burkholderiales bacterium]|nr:membrane integrity-associated transporter subunit PqiC [Burkholderiales bacterium]
MRRPAPDALRRRLLRPLPLLGVAGLLGACSLGNAPRSDFYLLRDAAGPGAAAGGERIDRVLMVSAMAPPGLYDSDRMVFSADGLSRSYFQFGYWSERPAQSLQTLAEARLATAGRFRQVVSSTSGVRGDLLLSLRLDELYLDASQPPGIVWLGVSAELIDWRDRRLLGRRQLRQSAPMLRAGAPGLAEAAGQAMGVLLATLAEWSAATAAA